MDAQTDLKLMIKTYVSRSSLNPFDTLSQPFHSQRECLRRLEQISSTIVDTFVAFIRNSCFLLVNRSSIPSLLKRVQSRSGADSEAQSRAAVRVLEYVSKTRPELYRTHVAELSKTLGEGSSEGAVTVALHAISRLVKNDGTTVLDKYVPSLVDRVCVLMRGTSRKLSDRAKHFAREGTPSQARSAATIIAFDTARPGNAEDLVDVRPASLPPPLRF
jgi:sister-chromatid-cohesion protein PDS5